MPRSIRESLESQPLSGLVLSAFSSFHSAKARPRSSTASSSRKRCAGPRSCNRPESRARSDGIANATGLIPRHYPPCHWGPFVDLARHEGCELVRGHDARLDGVAVEAFTHIR